MPYKALNLTSNNNNIRLLKKTREHRGMDNKLNEAPPGGQRFVVQYGPQPTVQTRKANFDSEDCRRKQKVSTKKQRLDPAPLEISAGAAKDQSMENQQPAAKKPCLLNVYEDKDRMMSAEELKRICLNSSRLEQWCHMPFFADTVTGCFVRAVTQENVSNPLHCLTEIVSVKEIDQIYELGSTRTNQGMELRHAGIQQLVTLRAASDQDFTESEFQVWRRSMTNAGMQFPTPEAIANKEQSIKDAMNYKITDKDIYLIVERKNRFRLTPPSVARKRIELFEQQRRAKACNDMERVKAIQKELEELERKKE